MAEQVIYMEKSEKMP